MQLTKLRKKVMSFVLAGATMVTIAIPSVSVNAAQNVTVTNESSIQEGQVNVICDAVVENIEENYEGVFIM